MAKAKAKKSKTILHPAMWSSSKRCEAPPARWRVLDRHCNYSAFNGNHYTPSDYSSCKCLVCGWIWRTKANYVAQLADAKPAERIS